MQSTPNIDHRYLQDQSEITALVYRYAQGIDDRDVEAVLSCVSEDAVLSFNGGELILHGSGELRQYLSSTFADEGPLNPRTRGTHMMANTLVTVTDDRAIAETSAVTYLATPAGSIITRGIHYSDECARIDGKWAIVNRRHRSDWQMEAPGKVLG